MESFNQDLLKQLYVPASGSRKGDNGKVLIIGGSDLFHSPAFWAFEVVSKIADMVYFSSTPMNNEILKNLKSKFINGIIVPRDRVGEYIEDADSILIGPGLPRDEGLESGEENTKNLTESLLSKFPHKKWVIDGGSLQVIKPDILPSTAIVTPNKKEFELLFRNVILSETKNLKDPSASLQDDTISMAKKFGITILLKGEVDYVCGPFDSPSTSSGQGAQGEIRTMQISGGNAGMTKGGTGDVLAGLTAVLYAKNDAFLSAVCASFINKKSGESLEKRVGIYFNASDLVAEIPKVMKEYI